VQNYINRIKSKLNANNFQQLITEKLGASFLRYLPIEFLAKDAIFDDASVIRNAFVVIAHFSSSPRSPRPLSVQHGFTFSIQCSAMRSPVKSIVP
jgi:hypothetical protein